MDKQHGHETQKFRTDIQLEQAAWKSSRDKLHICTDMHTPYSKSLAFPLAEWI
jgi:hypothetical protein